MDATVRVRSVAWVATAVVLSVVCTLLVTQAWSVGAAPGDEDSTFVPTAGCRLADTRPAPRTVGPRNTPLAADDIHEVTVRGSNGECTGALAIPTDAVGVALNVTATNATASSNIRVYPANLTQVPLLSNLNVTAGAPPTPNKVDVKLSPDGKIKVYNFNGSVNVILDVVGYYTDTSLKELSAGLAAANAKIADSELRIAALEDAEPFAVSGVRVGVTGLLTTTPGAVLDVTVTAPVDGQVTLNYSTYVELITASPEAILCAPFRSTEIPANLTTEDEGLGYWRIGGAVGSSPAGSVSGTRTFDISAGQTVTYSVACEKTGPIGSVGGRTATAIFTPAP